MAELRRQGIPSFLINARVSPSSFKSYRHAKRLFSPALNTFSRIYPQSSTDAEAYRELGVNPEKLEEPGNLKFDAAKMLSGAAKVEQLGAKLGLQKGERVLVAGSTHEGEEAILRASFLQLRQSLPGLKLRIAPRHPHRAEEVRRVFIRDPFKVVF